MNEVTLLKPYFRGNVAYLELMPEFSLDFLFLKVTPCVEQPKDPVFAEELLLTEAEPDMDPNIVCIF